MSDDSIFDPTWEQAVEQQESGGNPNAVSPKGAIGSMQTLPTTLKDPGYGVAPAKDDSPEEKKRVGVDYLHAMGNKYGDPTLGLIAYNYGPKNTDNWIAKGGNIDDLPKETQQYVNGVANHYNQIKSKTVTIAGPQTPVVYQTTQAQPVDPIEDALSGNEKNLSATSSGTPSNPPAQIDPIEQALSDKTEGSKSASTSLSQHDKDFAGTIGINRGLGDDANTVVNAGAWLDNKLGITSNKDLATLHAEQEADKGDFDTKFGKSGWAQAGRVGGQILGSTPLLAAGGSALSGIADAAGEAVPMLKTPLNFLTGNLESNAVTNEAGQIIQPASIANKLARFASSVPVGAAGGAAANTLVGGDPRQGAEIGAIAGPATYLAGQGINALANKTGLPGYVAKLKQSLVRDGYTTPTGELDTNAVQNKLTQLGEGATIADLGPNTSSLAGAVAQAPGQGKEIISSALEARQAGQSERLKSSVLSGLGLSSEDTYESAVPKLIEQRQSQSAPIYKEAYEANKSVATPEINRILQTPAGKAALKDAVTTMQNSRELVGVSDPDLVEQAALTGAEPTGDGISGGLKLKTLDQVKQSLYDLGESAKNKFGDATTQSNAIHQLRKDLTSELDKADTTGKYAAARVAYAGPSQSLDALDNGTEFIKSGGSQNATKLSTMSDQDKQFFRIGAAKQIQDMIQNTPDGADAVKKIFNTPGKRDALRSVFPNEEAFNEFENTARSESTFYKTRGHILGNSLTHPRIQAAQDLTTPQKVLAGAAALGGHAAELAQRNTVGKIIYGGQLLANKLMKPGTLSSEDSEALARALITPEGRKAITTALTPAASQGKNLLNSYIAALHGAGTAAISGNALQAPQQP